MAASSSSLWSPETGSHGSLLNPRNLCRGGRVAVETCPKGYLSLPSTSPLAHLRAIHTFASGKRTLTHGLFAIVHTTRVYCVFFFLFFLLLLLDNVYAPEARQTNRRSTCVLMNAVFDLEWWTPSGLGEDLNETKYRGKALGGDFVCNTVPWIDLTRMRRDSRIFDGCF